MILIVQSVLFFFKEMETSRGYIPGALSLKSHSGLCAVPLFNLPANSSGQQARTFDSADGTKLKGQIYNGVG